MAKPPKKDEHKYIFVLGGVMSGVGKGVVTSSIGFLLKQKGFVINLAKVDPYLNVDAGTMNPTEHGEVFVLESGLETDQDMGTYERFLGRDLTNADYMTSGMVYESVIMRERALGYGGKCVEAIPHVRDEIIHRIEAGARESKSKISVVEIGGTVGDFQNALFIDAARVIHRAHPENVIFVMVSYLPTPGTLGEMKTKPTQTAVHALNSYGVQPDFIVCRSKEPIDAKRIEKIAVACNVLRENIIPAPDISCVYEAPLNFEKTHLADRLLVALHLAPRRSQSLNAWRTFTKAVMREDAKPIEIAIIGKYFDTGDFVLSDAYLSVIEALKFSAAKLNRRVRAAWINAKDFENGKSVSLLKKYDGIIVPGGFGESGIEGKIQAIRYAREHKIPYLGLCYGIQLMVIEYARNVAKLASAHTTEIAKNTPHPIVTIMEEQKNNVKKESYGGTMRLGAYEAKLKDGTIARRAYGATRISERHRHRYEINPAYIEPLEKSGLIFSGSSPNGILMEIAELPKKVHPFMLGTQFHPELKARPLAPHPLFNAFLEAADKQRERQ